NGTRLGPLDGVPVSWKDLFDTAGTATEAGTALLAGRVPDTDAAVLQSAGRAGLVCLGKTHLSELAFSGLGLNPVTATPPNINDPEAVPGGSSSGAAASVAFGLAPGAIGSDTGGSVRVPAAWNDLVGLKTTHGRLSLTGVVPLAAWFDTVGPLTRTVEDAALLLSAMEGTGAPDLSGASLTGAEFFVLDPYTKDAREAPGAAFEAAVSRLSSAGAKITRGAVPAVDRAFEEAGMLLPVEAYGTWKHLIETAPDKMYPPILERFRSGAAVSGPDYVAGWKSLEIARAEYLGATAGYDAVLLPTSPILPPNRARLMADHDYYVTENLLTLRNTRIGNLLGLCGLSLPTGTPSCGVMLLCPPMADLRLLRLGAAVEAALLA
ncbi:MAG: amidase family protein, partial [Pseudomonadota bacterium]